MLSKHGIKVHEDGIISKVKKVCQQDLRVVVHEQTLRDEKGAEQSTRNILKAAAIPDNIKQALLRLIILHDLPLNAVEWPQLHTFVHTINYMASNVIWTSRSGLTKALERNFELKQEVVKQQLQDAVSLVHLCTDTWHSPNRKELQGTTAHFVDKHGKLQKALLALDEMPRGHGSEELAPVILQTLDSYGIKDKLGYITSDNARENDALCRLLANGLEDWDPVERRLRCFGHIINLPVQAFLFAKSKAAVDYATTLSQAHFQDTDSYNAALSQNDATAGWIRAEPLQKLLTFVDTIRASDRLYNAFKDHCGGKTVHKPNDTRWNSHLDCFEDALALDSQYNEFIRNNEELEHLELTLTDWRLVRETCDFLRPFKEAVLRCEGDYVTLDKLQISMDYVLSHLRESKVKYHSSHAMYHAIHVAWHAFDKYYDLIDQTGAYAAAVLLHPSRRKAWLDAVWLPKWVRNGIDKAKELWSRYNIGDVEAARDSSHSPELSPFLRWQAAIQSKQRSGKLNDEFNLFITAPAIDVATSPLDWWQQPAQRHAYPRLSKMAIDVLSAPAMSAEAERVFSHGRRVIPWTRTTLCTRTINQLLCLKHWMTSGVVTEHIEVDIDD